MNDDLTNPEDKIATEQKPSQHGRVFNFLGKPLRPYSFTHRLAYYRICPSGNSSMMENAMMLLYLLSTCDKAACENLQNEKEIRAFRLQAAEWAETNWRDGIEAAMAVFAEIMEDAFAADSVNVKSKSKPMGNE